MKFGLLPNEGAPAYRYWQRQRISMRHGQYTGLRRGHTGENRTERAQPPG